MATAVGILGLLGAIGAVVMSLAHSGLQLPVIPAPEIWPVAIGFAFGSVLFVVVAWAAFTQRAWAWPVALAVNAIAFASAVMPWRGLDRSGLPALVTLLALVLLVTPAGREALPTGGHERAPTNPSRS